MNKKLIVSAILTTFILAGCSAQQNADTNAPATETAKTSEVASAAKTNLDATEFNPGTSIDPIDKGKTIKSDQFEYTLLDVREDTFQGFTGEEEKVLLVKLAVKNITQKNDLNLSVAEVELARDKKDAVRPTDNGLFYKPDFFYDREKVGVDLATDIGTGTFPAGKTVVGYYIYTFDEPYTNLYFNARNFGADTVGTGASLDIGGSFTIK